MREVELELVAAGGAELPAVRAMASEAMHAEPLSRERFAQLIADIGPEHVCLARIGGRPIGCVIGAHERRPSGDRGWLVGFGVREEERNRGLGTRMLRLALGRLRGAGCVRVDVGGPGESYLVPGIDPQAYPAAVAVARAVGLRPRGHTEAMHADLAGRRPPSVVPGLTIRAPRPVEFASVTALVGDEFSASWTRLIGDSLASGCVLVAFVDGEPVGFAGHDLFVGCPGRFGPTGVSAAARGRGIGRLLLQRALAELAAAGHRRAWFLWGPEGEAGRAMYRTAGFTVHRDFTFWGRELTPEDLESPVRTTPSEEDR